MSLGEKEGNLIVRCNYGYCTAPDTTCPHWQVTFCELDLSLAQLAFHYTPKAKLKFIISDERSIVFEEVD